MKIVDLLFNGGLVGSFQLPHIVVVSTDELIITNFQKNPSLSHTIQLYAFNRQSSYIFFCSDFRFMVQYLYVFTISIIGRLLAAVAACFFYFFFLLCKFIIKKREMRKLLPRILMVILCGYGRKYNL